MMPENEPSNFKRGKLRTDGRLSEIQSVKIAGFVSIMFAHITYYTLQSSLRCKLIKVKARCSQLFLSWNRCSLNCVTYLSPPLIPKSSELSVYFGRTN